MRMAIDCARTADLEGIRGIRKLLSKEKDPPIQQVIDSGITPQVFAFDACLDSNSAHASSSNEFAIMCLGNILPTPIQALVVLHPEC